MWYPNLSEEKKLWKKKYKRVVGLDEVGRGPLAGPVVAAAVLVLNSKYKIQNSEIKDSKKLSQNQREKIYKELIKDKNIKWGIGKVSEKVIDKINILEATKLAMEKAIDNLKSKAQSPKPKIDYLILDGNFKINLKVPQKPIIKADEKVFSCAAASILAKVTRDRMMEKFHKKYPKYKFDKNKGYPTKSHKRILKKHGPCKIHRKSFYPINPVRSSF